MGVTSASTGFSNATRLTKFISYFVKPGSPNKQTSQQHKVVSQIQTPLASFDVKATFNSVTKFLYDSMGGLKESMAAKSRVTAAAIPALKARSAMKLLSPAETIVLDPSPSINPISETKPVMKTTAPAPITVIVNAGEKLLAIQKQWELATKNGKYDLTLEQADQLLREIHRLEEALTPEQKTQLTSDLRALRNLVVQTLETDPMQKIRGLTDRVSRFFNLLVLDEETLNDVRNLRLKTEAVARHLSQTKRVHGNPRHNELLYQLAVHLDSLDQFSESLRDPHLVSEFRLLSQSLDDLATSLRTQAIEEGWMDKGYSIPEPIHSLEPLPKQPMPIDLTPVAPIPLVDNAEKNVVIRHPEAGADLIPIDSIWSDRFIKEPRRIPKSRIPTSFVPVAAAAMFAAGVLFFAGFTGADAHSKSSDSYSNYTAVHSGISVYSVLEEPQLNLSVSPYLVVDGESFNGNQETITEVRQEKPKLVVNKSVVAKPLKSSKQHSVEKKDDKIETVEKAAVVEPIADLVIKKDKVEIEKPVGTSGNVTLPRSNIPEAFRLEPLRFNAQTQAKVNLQESSAEILGKGSLVKPAVSLEDEVTEITSVRAPSARLIATAGLLKNQKYYVSENRITARESDGTAVAVTKYPSVIWIGGVKYRVNEDGTF